MTRLLPRPAAALAVAALTVGGVHAAARTAPCRDADGGMYAVPAAGPVAVAQATSVPPNDFSATPYTDGGVTDGPALPGGTFSPDGSFTPDTLPPGVVIEGGRFDPGTQGYGARTYGAPVDAGTYAGVRGGFVAPQTFLPPTAAPGGDCGCDTTTVFSPLASEVPPLVGHGGCDTGGCATGGCATGGCGARRRGGCLGGGGQCTECDRFGRCAPGRYRRPLVPRRNNPVGGFSFGYEFVLLRPLLPETDAFTTTIPGGPGGRVMNREFDPDLERGSRITLETVMKSGAGLRFRWLGIDNDSDLLATTNPGGGARVTTPFFASNLPGQSVRAMYAIDLNVFDLEGTRRSTRRGVQITSGGGLRGADLEQRYIASRTGPGNDVNVRSKASFEGLGPMVFAELRRPIGGTGFAFLALGRASLLYGERTQIATVADVTGTSVRRIVNDTVVPVGEIQLGGEYSMWLNEKTIFFTHAAWETQVWQGVGNAYSRGDDFGLTGVNVALGLEW